MNISNRPTLTPDMYMLFFLDTDKNAATGATDFLGAEYAIELDPGAVESLPVERNRLRSGFFAERR